jgi:hypothetical protein
MILTVAAAPRSSFLAGCSSNKKGQYYVPLQCSATALLAVAAAACWLWQYRTYNAIRRPFRDLHSCIMSSSSSSSSIVYSSLSSICCKGQQKAHSPGSVAAPLLCAAPLQLQSLCSIIPL